MDREEGPEASPGGAAGKQPRQDARRARLAFPAAAPHRSPRLGQLRLSLSFPLSPTPGLSRSTPEAGDDGQGDP